MAKSLKDQLKDWKSERKDLEEELRDLKAGPRRAVKPAPATAPKVDDVDDVDEGVLSDEELFKRAVEGMPRGSDAVLKKYDRTDAPRPSSSSSAQGGREISDRALFLDAVGEVKREDALRMKGGGDAVKKADARFARRVARGEVKPDDVIDLHGDDRARALERTRIFLDAEARTGSEVVLVVHGKGEGVLAAEIVRLLDAHAAVVEHVVAPRDLGGGGARVVRLRKRAPL